MNHIDELEAESMFIIREAAAECKNPVLLYSIGKDSSVLLHLAMKAFYPCAVPFPLLHIDTGYKFREMIDFRDQRTKELGHRLIVYTNTEHKALQFQAEQAHTDEYIYYKKTKPLLQAIKHYGFDAAFGGARREEEKSRAKERIFSHRATGNVWDPKNQRPEIWNLFNPKYSSTESFRIFPLSNWTELDIWLYIRRENIPVVPLYFAVQRKVVYRHNVYLRLDEFVQQKNGEAIIDMMCRYRTLGCSPSTGAIPSRATTLDDIINEIASIEHSERQTRAIDHGSECAMEYKKKEGYF